MRVDKSRKRCHPSGGEVSGHYQKRSGPTGLEVSSDDREEQSSRGGQKIRGPEPESLEKLVKGTMKTK